MGVVMMLLAMMLLPFSVLRAAMLTQPPIAEIEEVSGLVHLRSEISNLRSQNG